jgi:Lipopolysaccharide-assembly
MRLRIIVYFFCIVLSIFNCCGYSTNVLIAPHLKTIAIPLVGNQTIRPGLGEALTDSLISAFTKDRHLRVTNIENADVVLTCQITSYDKAPQSYDAAQNVYAYQITINASCQCEDKVKSETIWEEGVSAWITYDPNAVTEDKGVDQAIAKLSTEILRRTLTSW